MRTIIGIDNNMQFEVVITGFKTRAQADAFVTWYKLHGEQEANTFIDETKKINGTPKRINGDDNYPPPSNWYDNTITTKLQSQ